MKILLPFPSPFIPHSAIPSTVLLLVLLLLVEPASSSNGAFLFPSHHDRTVTRTLSRTPLPQTLVQTQTQTQQVHHSHHVHIYIHDVLHRRRQTFVKIRSNDNDDTDERNGLAVLENGLSSTEAADMTTSSDSSSSSTSSSTTRPGSLMEATLREGKVPYGETSRKYRRTEFTYDNWVSHRNEDKQIISNIRGMFFSGIIRQLQQEIALVTAIALMVVLWNDLAAVASYSLDSGLNINSGVFDAGVLHLHLPRLSLPSLPFTLSSPALGLLLVFKTNASYARWLEARNTWSKIISQSRNLVRMSFTFVSDAVAKGDVSSSSSANAMQELSDSIWLLCRCLMNGLSDPSDEEEFQKEVRDAFQHPFAEKIIASNDRTMAALTHASCMLDNIPIDEKRRVEIDKSLVIIGDCISVCEKIYSSPVPLVYTRHTGRFLSLWMLLLPTALYDSFAVGGGVVSSSGASSIDAVNAADATSFVTVLLSNLQCFTLVPTAAMIGLFLFGIDELAIQLEEPFSILPMQNFCDGIRKASRTVNEWSSLE